MADLMVAPYLPLGKRQRVGPWDLVPVGALDDTDALPDEFRAPVLRLVEAYRAGLRRALPMG